MSEEELKDRIRKVCQKLWDSVGEYRYISPKDQAYAAVRVVREALEEAFELNK